MESFFFIISEKISIVFPKYLFIFLQGWLPIDNCPFEGTNFQTIYANK